MALWRSFPRPLSGRSSPYRASIPFTAGTRASDVGLKQSWGRSGLAPSADRTTLGGRRCGDRHYPYNGRGPEQRVEVDLHVHLVFTFEEGLVVRRQVFQRREEALEAVALRE